jgi:nucleoside 2-deoxyribosyltransferase
MASKFQEQPLVRNIQREWKEVHFTNRWQLQPPAWDEEPEEAYKFWQDDLADVARADYTMIYANGDYRLSGALVEAGYALSLGQTIIVIGKHPSYATWQYHPNCVRVDSLEAAREYLRH